MKKITKMLMLAIFLFAGLSSVNSAKARLSAEGFLPPEDANLFWNAFSNLDRPDDYSECVSLISSCGDEQASQVSEMLCSDFAEIPQTIYDDMESDEMLGDGMETTNLLNEPDWHNIENLTFESPIGKIEFAGTTDFMSYDFMLFILEFPERVRMGPSYIKFDADLVEDLKNRDATVTMKQVPHFNSPAIIVDGKTDEEGVVSSLEYNEENHTLVFDAAHFTTFEAIEDSELEGYEEPEINEAKARKFVSKHGKQRIRLAIYGHHFGHGTDIKLGSKDPYKVRRKIRGGEDKIVAFFSLPELVNLGHRKLTVHAINSNDLEDDYDDKVDLEDLEDLKLHKYHYVYHDIQDYLRAVSFLY